MVAPSIRRITTRAIVSALATHRLLPLRPREAVRRRRRPTPSDAARRGLSSSSPFPRISPAAGRAASRPQILIEADATDPAPRAGDLACGAPWRAGAARGNSQGPLAAAQVTGRRSSRRGRAAPALQSRRHHALQHRAGPARRHPHHDHGDDDGDGRDARDERGTMENLLAMPVSPIEVMLGKIAPYHRRRRGAGRRRAGAAKLLFGVPFEGSIAALRRGDRAVHHRQPRHRLHLLDHRPATSCRPCRCRSSSSCPPSCCRALPSRSAACRLGAGDRRGPARHAFHPHRPRTDAEGRRRWIRWRAKSPYFAFMLVLVATVAVSRYRVTLD
jgi:hypothetical protein